MTRIYIAGPMTGLKDLNFPAFHAVSEKYRALGYEVVNPAELCPDKTSSWLDCMRADIKALVDCEQMVMLPNWENSKGARIEYDLAWAFGMTIIFLCSEEVAA